VKPTLRKDGRYQVRVPRKQSPTGKRQSHYFPSRTQADRFIREFRDEHREHGRQAVTAEERRWIGYWRERVGDLSLMPEIVHFWKHSGEHLQPMPAIEAAKVFCESVEHEYANKRTWHDIEYRLRRFGSYFGAKPLHEITVAGLEAFLATFKGYNRWSYHKRLRPFYKFALRRRWIAVNVADEVPKPKTPTPERAIYTVEQFERLLTLAKTPKYAELLPYLVLAGYCFMRNSELVRKYANEQVLLWSDIHWSESLIHVRPEVAKGTRRHTDERYVPIIEPVRKCLEDKCRDSGSVVNLALARFGELWQALTDEAHVERITNGLRHSAISYALAANPQYGLALVAQWAGNSESAIRKHYRRLLKQKEGRRWFPVGGEPSVTEPTHGIFVGDQLFAIQRG
jgi:hypothetical protein